MEYTNYNNYWENDNFPISYTDFSNKPYENLKKDQWQYKWMMTALAEIQTEQ